MLVPGRLLLAARLLIGAAALGAVLAAVALGRQRERQAATAGAAYACPMHPQVRGGPGTCPLCRMTLVPATAGALSVGEAILPLVLRLGRDVVAPARLEADGRVAALLHRDELALLAPGEIATLLPAATGAGLLVRFTGETPVSWDQATALARFRAERPLRRSDVGWVQLRHRDAPALAVPYPALVQTPAGPAVLVVAADGALERRQVTVGRVIAGLAVVVAGLHAHERIVGGSALLVETERRLRAGAAEATP